MANVERFLTVPKWAARISVERDGEILVVHGKGRRATPAPPDELSPGQDLLGQYTQYSRVWEKRSGKRPPHVQFANATNDNALIAFVKRYGPVQTFEELFQLPTDGTVIAKQDMRSLRRDRIIFSGATKLVAGSGCSDVDARDLIADGLWEIFQGAFQGGPATELHTVPYHHERLWYGQRILPLARDCALDVPTDVATDLPRDPPMNEVLPLINPSRLRRMGQIVLSTLLNCFPPQLTPIGRKMMELPVHDPTGILPALYFMLRQDCLRDQSIAICARPLCGKVFEVERFGQRFCSAECSRLQRQREYWQRRGKEARKKRLNKQRRSKGAK
jgi:hypothetical protein